MELGGRIDRVGPLIQVHMYIVMFMDLESLKIELATIVK